MVRKGEPFALSHVGQRARCSAAHNGQFSLVIGLHADFGPLWIFDFQFGASGW
jgi:hypothetical protein